ncbi:MAG: SpoIIE family protein phosphatase [Bacteroidales bacterium]|nr:SpoIIE family protein phosphatase [Bacteroidales bacterium]
MKRSRSIFKHALAITIVTFVVVGVGTAGYILWQMQQHRDMVAAAHQEREDMADRIWKAKTENFQNAVRDNSAWDDLVDFTENYGKQPDDSAWLEDNFGYMLSSYTAAMVAIFDVNGRCLYSKVADGYEDFDFFSLDFLIFSKKFKETGLTDFYMYKDDVLMEFFGASITTSADNEHHGTPKGFLLLCREIDDEVIEDYRISVGAKSTVISVQHHDSPSNNSEDIIVTKSFNNYNNHSEAYICSFFENTVEKFFDEMKPVFGIFALLCVIAMINLLVFMRHKMMKPLSLISESLSDSDPTIINDLAKKKNEFGQIALMLQKFFMQQEEVKIQNETLVLQSEEIRSINDDLNQQKNDLAKVNLQITDSIEYAGRIQRSAVSQIETVRELFPDSMVIYLPRDIVSGDWYYVAQLRNKKVVVEADCTGHGVPGSLLSMLGISALKDILSMMEINDEAIRPETVLERMRTTIKKTLIQQSDDIMSMNDGMDMSIAIIENDNSSLRFAGANQALFIMRDAEIIKLKRNRMPIGNYVRETPFEGEDFALQKDDVLVFMSDGIKDQTNADMEKFRWMRLEAFLIENSALPMPVLGEKLVQTISQWQGDTEQVDDMTMIGIRV